MFSNCKSIKKLSLFKHSHRLRNPATVTWNTMYNLKIKLIYKNFGFSKGRHFYTKIGDISTLSRSDTTGYNTAYV